MTAPQRKIDPELAAIVAQLPEQVDLETDPIQIRAQIRKFVAGQPRIEDPRVTYADRRIPGPPGAPEIMVRIHTPSPAPRPAPAVV